MWDLIDDVVEERPRLENAPLKSVVCQAWFPRQLNLGDDEVRPIQRALGRRYPLVSEEQGLEVTLEGGRSQDPFLWSTGGRQRIFRFRDATGSWAATIAPETIALETTAYAGMKDLLLRWSELATAAAEVLELTAQTRLGLRFVNELDLPEPQRMDRPGWVRDELISLLRAEEPAERPLCFVSQAQFRQADGSSCNMRHGLTPSEEDEGRTVFLLDLDCFRGEDAKFDPAEQIRNLARLNDCAYRYFTWAFDEKISTGFEVPGHDRTDPGNPRPGRDSVDYFYKGSLDLGVGYIHLEPHGVPRLEHGEQVRHYLVELKSPDAAPSPSPETAALPDRVAEPLPEVLGSIRESIDISVADLARMFGLQRRQFYNLLRGSPTSTETEARIRRLQVVIERLAAATEGGPQSMRAAVLTPVGPDAINLFEAAESGDGGRITATAEALLAHLETRGARRARRAIPRPVPPAFAERRRRLMRESLDDRSPPKRKGSGD